MNYSENTDITWLTALQSQGIMYWSTCLKLSFPYDTSANCMHVHKISSQTHATYTGVWIKFTLEDNLVTSSQGGEQKGRTQTFSVAWFFPITSVPGVVAWSLWICHETSCFQERKGDTESKMLTYSFWVWLVKYELYVGCSQSSLAVWFFILSYATNSPLWMSIVLMYCLLLQGGSKWRYATINPMECQHKLNQSQCSTVLSFIYPFT